MNKYDMITCAKLSVLEKIPTSNILIIRTQIKWMQERNHTAYTSEYRKL